MDDLDRMSKAALVAELRRLRGKRAHHSALETAIHDLRVNQEEVQIQRDQLIEAQRLLEQSRDWYVDLYDYAPLAYVTFDPSGVIQDINLTGADLLGKGRISLVGKPFWGCVVEEDRRAFLEHMRRCRAGESPVISEFMLNASTGPILAQLHSTRALNPAGEQTTYRTALVDLTARLEAEEARARAAAERQRLRHEEETLRAENEAKDRFLAMLSHELRTPLTPILAAVTSLEGHADVPAALCAPLAMIRRNIEHETRLIDDLLDLTRITNGKLSLNLEVVDVHEAIRDAEAMCASERPREVVVRTALAATEAHVRADPVRIRQVLWNLLRNAYTSLPAGGEVTVRTANGGPGRLSVVLSDTGSGIERGDLEHIFRPFYQARAAERPRGLGLGLAICKSVIESHGGTISAASDGRGSGASFTIELATVSAPELRLPTSAPQAVASEDPAPRMLILLVEDHEDTAEVVSQALSLEGYDVKVARSVATALESAREGCDLIISDLGLPDGSGLDLMREVRSVQSVKGIALSGYGSENDVRESKAAGFDEHLTKPVTIEKLRTTIQNLTKHLTPGGNRYRPASSG